MGFPLGKALGKLAGGVIKSATGINVNFAKPSAGTKGGSSGGKTGVTCPPGTMCDAPSWGSLCTGKCVSIPGGGMGQQPGYLTPAMTMAYCASAVGPGKIRLMPSPCRGYHWNESRYAYGLGSGQCQVVERGTKLVRNRSINPANAKAAHRAVRRLIGTHRLLVGIERSIAPLARRVHGGRGSRSKCAGGCKGKCKCG